jgi:putative transposase
MDFVSDALGDGRKFRALTLVDDFTREAPAIAVDFSLPGERVVHVLEQLAATRGLPKAIVCDNGPEFGGETPIGGRMHAAWHCSSFNPASRFRTRSRKASTAGSVTSVSTRAGS